MKKMVECETSRPLQRRMAAWIAALAMSALAAGCGGGGESWSHTESAASMAMLVAAETLPATAAGPVAAIADDGARVIAEETVGPRMVDLTIDSPALGTTVKVRLVLPSRWSATSKRTWPVLYLLHGAGADYAAWSGVSDVAALTENRDVLVVMPEGGRAGFYSDWWNFGLGGTPGWETFHLTELRQILERGYHAGTQRAIAGFSMGGFGAMSYAARHPGMFAAAASYSGAVHTQNDPPVESSFLLAGIAAWGSDPLALWGDPVLQRDLWAAHNPYDLAPLLRGTKLYVASGNGQPGPLDDPVTTAPVDAVEVTAYRMTTAFTRRLEELGIEATVDLYGPGTHTGPYYDRSLRESFPMLMNAIGVRVSAQ
jgi:diacylglycerol O-acyltransferase / trehalose O-mycolyltransferase